jgi:hypothetical protein
MQPEPFCKIIQETEVMVDYDSQSPDVYLEHTHWNDEGEERLKESCKGDTLFRYRNKKTTCVRYAAAARYAVKLQG